MPDQPRKMSEVMKEMAEGLLRNPDADHSSEAVHVALFFATVAWNEGVGIDGARESYRNVWETIEAEDPELWNEFKSNDTSAMIDELIRLKKGSPPERPPPHPHLRRPGRQDSGRVASRPPPSICGLGSNRYS